MKLLEEEGGEFLEDSSGLRGGEGLRWILKKVVQCGEVVEEIVDGCPGEWNDVIRFPAAREEQNNSPLRRLRRKLQKLSSSVNYEKNKEGKEVCGSIIFFFFGLVNEDLDLECSRLGE